MTSELRAAVFLDRDGTLNREVDYLRRIEDFAFIPGVPEAIRRLNAAGFLVVVVTNQSGIARGLFPRSTVEELHRHIDRELAACGAHIDGYYICPHHPDFGAEEERFCSCRKGQPGLLLQAAGELGIDLSRSYMVGDKSSDLEAGSRAGCREILVLTGYGRETLAKAPGRSCPVYLSLAEAVAAILDK